MFEMQVTDYLGVVHTLRYVTEPSEEQKIDIIESFSASAADEISRAQFEKKTAIGKYISNECAYLLSQRNLKLNKDSAFIDLMLSRVVPVKTLLEIGSLSRSKEIIIQLQYVYGADYSDIFQDALDDLDKFNKENL